MAQDLSVSLENLRLELRDIANDGVQVKDHVYAERIKDAADLLRVLAKIVDGKDICAAFGAPGDWGYNTPIGQGVLTLHEKALAAHRNVQTFVVE